MDAYISVFSLRHDLEGTVAQGSTLGRGNPLLITLSPAKSLDYESPLATKKKSEARFLDQSQELVTIMAKRSPEEISELMGISPDLGALNYERFQDFETPLTPKNARAALLAFSGDVYIGLDAQNRFNERDFTHAQKTIRILSGLYGVLRPLDLIAPYRLEMGTKLENQRGKNLYDFWKDTIAPSLAEDLESSPGSNVIINLASNEYFGSVDTSQLDAKIVTPQFLDPDNSGELRVISFFAKRARGSMAGWAVKNRIKGVRGLNEFDELGYKYDKALSTTQKPTFVRA